MNLSPTVFRGATFSNQVTEGALHAWQARQPEIDVLETENRRLSDSLEAIDLDTKILVDEIDALKAEVERLRDLMRDLPPLCEIERLQRNEAELRNDAERYQWLRNPAIDPGRVIDKRVRHVGPDGETDSIDWEYRAGEELDKAIDKAMKETK